MLAIQVKHGSTKGLMRRFHEGMNIDIKNLIPAVDVMSFVVIPREERYLETRFLSDYLVYKTSVRRLL